jgi:hypothetical protein
MDIGSTKIRILSICAGKSKTMENQQNQSKSSQNQVKPTCHTWQRLFLYYFMQAVNSQKGQRAAIILLHRRSGGHRHSPG